MAMPPIEAPVSAHCLDPLPNRNVTNSRPTRPECPCESGRPRRLKVDGELELARLNHRQVRGLRPFEDIARIDADLTKHVRDISSIAHQPANLHKFTL